MTQPALTYAPRKTAFLYSDQFLAYNLGPRHPLKQHRLKLVRDLLAEYGALAPDGPITCLEAAPATEADLLRVHTPDFVDMVRRVGSGYRGPDINRYGLGPGDTPAFNGMFDAALLYAGGTVDAARLVLSGEYTAAFNVAGGLHHAHPDHASGFCTFNDLALGIHTLLDGGMKRVAYIDIDAHHGDGVQACFYDDPRVLTISLHESGQFLYPGTGFPDELGDGAAVGTSLNVPFAPNTGDEVWHEAFDQVVPSALQAFAPDAIVLQLGADAHAGDPLAHLMLSSQGWMQAVDKLLTLADGLPLVVTGGGGYNVPTVVRLWTMVTARLAGLSLSDAVPAAFAARENLRALHDLAPPELTADSQQKARDYVQAQVTVLRQATGI